MRNLSVLKRNILLSYAITALSMGCLLLAQTSLHAAEQPNYAALNTGTSARLESLRAEHALPSISMAILKDGKLVFVGAAGLADVENKIQATPTTQYSVGSIAKPMTGIALAKLIEEGKIDLNAEVHQYLPEYPKTEHPITIAQLASHTAGIVHGTMERMVREYQEVRDHRSPMEALDLFSQHPLQFKPGSSFQYSSSGYIVLSAVIEKVSGRSFLAYMQEEIWQALGMELTEQETSLPSRGFEAHYYASPKPGGGFKASRTPRDRSFLFGAGGFISTPTDLLKLSGVILDAKILKPQSIERMLSPIPLSNGEANPQLYALGWRRHNFDALKLNGEPLKAVHHGGTTGGAASAFLVIVPEHNAALAFATNMVPKDAALLREQVGAILVDYIKAGLH